MSLTLREALGAAVEISSTSGTRSGSCSSIDSDIHTTALLSVFRICRQGLLDSVTKVNL